MGGERGIDGLEWMELFFLDYSYERTFLDAIVTTEIQSKVNNCIAPKLLHSFYRMVVAVEGIL